MHLRTLFVNINFKYELEPHCEIVFPESYLFEAVFYQDFVSAGRTRKGNKNYLTFIKSSKIFGKIILCKRLPHVNKKYKKPNTFVALQRWSQDINRKVGVFFMPNNPHIRII